MTPITHPTDDTIAAIATPAGTGGLAVIRLSGPKSLDIAYTCLPHTQKLAPYQATYSYFIDPTTDEHVDEIVSTYFQAPKSYTAEDIVEISCHGGAYIAQNVLQILLDNGARMAEPGEFTKRAFLNGRIDLSQAEAVSDLIAAQTSASHKTALYQLKGRLKQEIESIRQNLINTISLLELELDFSEEEIDKTDFSEIEVAIHRIKTQCEQLIDSYRDGKIYRDGIYAAIVGRPNAGKSSILNALLKEDRALVSEIAGTTRDTIEESISHNGIKIRLVDTAGLRESQDAIESMGIGRAEEVMERADILLHIIDITEDSGENDLGARAKPVLKIYNKIDLLETPPRPSNDHVVYTSAKEMRGISEIGDAIITQMVADFNYAESTDTPIISKERHKKALQSAVGSFHKAAQSARNKMSSEFIVVDLRAGLNSLGKITGETTTDEILNNIFNNFCIGK